MLDMRSGVRLCVCAYVPACVRVSVLYLSVESDLTYAAFLDETLLFQTKNFVERLQRISTIDVYLRHIVLHLPW